MTKAFLFDMDGTIFDTEKVYKKCWHEVSQVMGYEIPDELIDMMRGSSQPTGKGYGMNTFPVPMITGRRDG